jgi:hypothetical protein
MKNKKRLDNKKGFSHIEVVLSFIIFLGFVIFLFAIFNPFKINTKSDVYIDMTERAIMDNISAKINFFTLKLKEGASSCFYFTYGLNLSNIVVKDNNYERLGASSILIDNKKQIKIDGTGNFFYIYSSDEFEENAVSGSCGELTSEEYSIGLFRIYKMVSFSKLNSLIEKHNSDYSNLKKEMGLTKDFSFNVRESSGNIIVTTDKKPPKIEVFARDEPIQLVYQNGSFKYAILNIRVW